MRPSPRAICLWLVLWLGAALALAVPARAQLTFPAASPISAGNVTVRLDPIVTNESGGVQSITAQSVALYGATANLALILENNSYVWNSANVGVGGRNVPISASGAGDTLLEARYTVVQIDGIGSTFRIAPIVGINVPTGADGVTDALGQSPRLLQPGSGNWGGRGALTSSWQTLYWNAAAEVAYQKNAEGAGYLFGNQFRADAAFHYLLWPRSFDTESENPGEWFASIETNYYVTAPNRALGAVVPDTGGQQWLVDPGFYYTTPLAAAGINALLPVYQHVAGLGSRYTWGLEALVRLSLYTPHHW